MTTYTLTEAQRKTLLDVADADFNASMHELLQSLTPNSGELAAPSTSLPFVPWSKEAEMRGSWAAPAKPAQLDHTKQANAALAAASNRTRDIVKLVNETLRAELDTPKAAPSTSPVDMDVLINELTHTAACYHDYSSLRQRIADVVSAHIKGGA